MEQSGLHMSDYERPDCMRGCFSISVCAWSVVYADLGIRYVLAAFILQSNILRVQGIVIGGRLM